MPPPSGTRATPQTATGSLVDLAGARWYRIERLEELEPFLTTVVSDSDLWLFLSSAGTLTAGRGDADHAFLPYETDDRLHRAAEVTGPVTLLARGRGASRELWQPFGRELTAGCTRAIAKHELGTAVLLEETNARWGLRYRVTWEPSRAFGWVRTLHLDDLSGDGASIEVVDGLLDVLPAGVSVALQSTRSNLVTAYRRSETGIGGFAAVYALESGITDRAEPSEALAATLVWSTGFEGAEVHLDERVLAAARHGREHPSPEVLTGRRGAYLLRGTVTVPAGGSRGWVLVADTPLGHAALHDRIRAAGRPDVRTRLDADLARGRERIAALLVAADAHQRTADPIADVHHRSNVLFNSMRGGVLADGYEVDTGDLIRFLAGRNRRVHDRHAALISELGPVAPLAATREAADSTGDPDLVRLVLEYLPLSFSRRHGDPSRPWNRFSIRVTDADGSEVRYHEGNWRDIFQNWEALLRSFPRYLPHAVATFVNASTLDGHNPYRISRDGIDWEVPDPEDPWSNIGYWGDHQIVYLLRLLEAWRAVAPGELEGWLDRSLFTYADVPYRLAGHEAMVADPRDTITYDADHAARIGPRVEAVGADGRLVVADGDLLRVTFAEKLLVPALAKLSSYVAGGGIWMNTQRPEWNDANNALAGWGLSMVTLAQLERYLAFLTGRLVEERTAPVDLTGSVAVWLAEVAEALATHDPHAAVREPSLRRSLLDALSTAGARHRERVAAGVDPARVEVGAPALARLLSDALAHVRASVRSGRRTDGLFHAYNLLVLPDDSSAEVRHLPLMLEGQVAVLGSTALSAKEVAELVERLYASPLYRPDQDSFLLYPVPELKRFLDRNRVPDHLVAAHPVLERLAGAGPAGILERDHDGGLHFRADLVNAVALRAALVAAGVPAPERAIVEEVYEALFRHHAFTGRSGGMHGYEGIGSIYWHMVAKLLLAVQERAVEVEQAGGQEALLERLTGLYRRIRGGLGFRKDPASYGAFPTDCYSHTPAHAGAQQPGMTGQVKEEILTRAGELGVRFAHGHLAWGRPMLPSEELWRDLDGTRGFELTVCATPVRVEPADRDDIRVERLGGDVEVVAGRWLDQATSAAVLDRTGAVRRLVVRLAEPGQGGTRR
ncbi:MAG: hypothetical protein ACLFV0_09660 [Nitriliruptoraceae bacterium]